MQVWSSSVTGGNAASEAAPNLRSVGRLQPWTGAQQERLSPGAFDLEVEVEQEGGGEEVLPAVPNLHCMVTLAGLSLTYSRAE